MPSPSPPTDASMGHAAHVEYAEPATEEEDWDSDNGSLQWEDFFGSSLELVPILLDMYDNLMAKNRDQDEPTNNVRPALSGCFNGLSRSRKNNASAPACNNGDEQLELIQYEASPQRTKGRCRPVNNICVDNDSKQQSVDGQVGDGAGSTASLAQYSDSSKATDSGYIEDLPANQWGNEKRRPLSVTSTSSSASSSSSLTRNHCNKKSYLASIESLNDADLSGEDDEYASRSRNGDGVVKSYPGGLHGSSANGSVPSTPRPKMCCDPSLTYIDRVVLEIVESERTYVTDINEIIEGYVGFVKNRSDLAISEDDVRDLFGNIEAIYIFNRGLLKELEQCGLDPVQIAQCFVQHNEGFSIYTHYCTNYPRTVSVLTDLMRKKETAEVFRERQAALGHTLPLGSFLLKPVQRILKYHLLLQNIVKHYDTSQVGYDVIVNALASMTGMAHHINDMKRKHEHAVRVQEIQSLLFGWEGADLTTFGELVAEGMFRISGAKAVRHVFLFDKMLLIAKKKEGGFLSYKTHIMCSNLMLIESIPGEPLCFHVIPFDNPRIQYTLQARSLEQKREWTLQLKRVILENYHAVIPYHARQLVMNLGQNRPEDELLAEKGNNSKRQHSAPEYLEKRKQERGRRKSEGGLNRALRMKKGIKKLELDSPSSTTCEQTKSRSRSSSHDGIIDKIRTRPLPDVTITSPRCEKKRREKLFKGWRRKSEPGDVTSSKESLTFSPVRENAAVQASLPNSPTIQTTTSKTETTSYLNALSVIEAFLRPDGHTKEETTDTENEEHSVERKRMANRGGIHIDDDDPSSDYVTFFFTQQHMQQVTSSSRCNKNFSSPSSSSVEYNANLGMRSKDASVGSSVKSSESSLGVPSTSHYDNLVDVWTNMNWVNYEKEKAGNTSNESLTATPKTKMSLRRAQSFNSQGTSNSESQGANFLRRSLRIPRPTRLDLAASPSFPVSPCYDRNLRLKMATTEKSEEGGNKKSGSLPRSFPLIDGYDPWISHGSSMESSLQELDDSSTGKFKTRLTGERPFTIASEKATHSFLNLEDFEKYMVHTSQTQRGGSFRFPVQSEESDRGNTTECTSTPGESLEDITETIHPEHKIYRSALSKASLKSVLSNVSSRLAHLKSSTSVHSDTSSCSNFTSDMEDAMQTRGREKERVSRRLMCSMAKVYTKVMKQHLRRSKSDEKDAGSPFSPCRLSLPIYRQGSPAIGARMASPIDTSEYSVPHHRKATRKNDEMRPDSVLSVSSNVTSSSDGDKTSGFGGSLDTTTTPCESTYNLQTLDDDKSAKDGGESDSDGSADSYYERSFEAIEGLLDNELFRDSAIYSDPEESAENCLMTTANDRYHGLKMPPPRPRKPSKNYEQKRSYSAATTPELEARETLGAHRRRVRGMTIMEKLKHLEDSARYRKDEGAVNVDGFKSIEQRRKDLELWQHAGNHRDADESETSSQHSTSTINTVVEMSLDTSPCSPGANQTSMKGWVKHIVGRFQEKTKPETCVQTANRLN